MIYEKLKIKDINENLKDSEAIISVYIPENSNEININKKRATVIICPGGAYAFTSDREAEPIALKFVAQGLNAIVIRYSVAPERYPKSLLELAATVNHARKMEEQWNVDKDKIILCGFSAGGHLAGSLGVLWHSEFIEKALYVKKEDVKPNAMILCYPVISSEKFAHSGSFDNLLGEKEGEINRKELSLEKLVTENTPKTFLWHTFNDKTVPVQNSLLFSNALAEKNIPFEMHIYPNGVHGLGLAKEITAKEESAGYIDNHVATWFKLACQWINNIN